MKTRVTQEEVNETFDVVCSPYNFVKKLSKLIDKDLHEQMVYNYIKKGYIVARTNELGKKYIEVEEQIRFATKYIIRNVNVNEIV